MANRQQSTGTVAVKVCQLVYRNKKRVRTGFDCFLRHQSSKFNQQHRGNEYGRGTNYLWSIEEEDKLEKVVEQHLKESRRRTPNWEIVRQRFPGTTPTQLATKWRRMTIKQEALSNSCNTAPSCPRSCLEI